MRETFFVCDLHQAGEQVWRAVLDPSLPPIKCDVCGKPATASEVRELNDPPPA
jgi:hypothetical protein